MAYIPTGRGGFIITHNSNGSGGRDMTKGEMSFLATGVVLNLALSLVIICRFFYLKSKGIVKKDNWDSAFTNYVIGRRSALVATNKVISLLISGFTLLASLVYLISRLFV